MYFKKYPDISETIYKDLLSKTYDYYIYNRSKSYHAPFILSEHQKKPSDEGSIDSLLSQDSQEVMDKLMNTSFVIGSRLSIHSYINYTIDNNWLELKNDFLSLESYVPFSNMNIERRRSMLTKELLGLNKQKLEEKVRCWEQLVQPINYFLTLFHQYQQLKQDKKLLGESD
ncbi:MAG: hypothetical protein KAI43_07330 [Candidatus Aureabacteria bacterium]|nr:hypothetical protein [Candidatus Auribacterota bacterium]